MPFQIGGTTLHTMQDVESQLCRPRELLATCKLSAVASTATGAVEMSVGFCLQEEEAFEAIWYDIESLDVGRSFQLGLIDGRWRLIGIERSG